MSLKYLKNLQGTTATNLQSLILIFLHSHRSSHTNNWAVLVDTSRFWFNYRHVANVLSVYRSVKRLGIPDSQVASLPQQITSLHESSRSSLICIWVFSFPKSFQEIINQRTLWNNVLRRSSWWWPTIWPAILETPDREQFSTMQTRTSMSTEMTLRWFCSCMVMIKSQENNKSECSLISNLLLLI